MTRKEKLISDVLKIREFYIKELEVSYTWMTTDLRLHMRDGVDILKKGLNLYEEEGLINTLNKYLDDYNEKLVCHGNQVVWYSLDNMKL